MNITFWTLQSLLFFNLQYDYRVSKDPVDTRYVSVNGNLTTCVYPGDKPFKKGSKTFPRSELRLKEELVDGVYNFTVDVIDVNCNIDYSLWQLFAGGPQVMIRYRLGQKQIVVFNGQPKFHVVDKFPRWCVIDCREKSFVLCEGGYVSYGEFACEDELHLKVGIYAQQMKPRGSSCCSTYAGISHDTPAIGD